MNSLKHVREAWISTD